MTGTEAFRRKYGPWALVTGAARGLGAEFARQLGARGLSVVLVDRIADEVARVADDVRTATGAETRAVVCDLSRPDFLAALTASTADLEVGLLISNAAFGPVLPFAQLRVEDKITAIDVNVRAPTLLVDAFAPLMTARGRGGVVLLSSTSAVFGSPLVGHYAATKAYNAILAESLWDELRRSGVDTLSLMPGLTDTPGLRSSNPKLGGMAVMAPAAVVAEALDALGRRPRHVAGRSNRVAMRALALLPRGGAIRLMSHFIHRIFP